MLSLQHKYPLSVVIKSKCVKPVFKSKILVDTRQFIKKIFKINPGFAKNLNL